MSRRMFITLIVMMAIVLSGLILVQAWMIKSASDIREEQFNQQVANALLRVAGNLEQEEQKLARRCEELGVIPGSKENLNEFGNLFPRNVQAKVQLSFSKHRITLSMAELYGNFKDIDTTKIEDKNQLVNNLEQRNKMLQWLNNTIWQNYLVILQDRPIVERIDSTQVQELLKSALTLAQIDLDYKFSIKNSSMGKETLILGNSDYRSKNKKEYFQALFQSDYSGPKPNYLNIYFPERRAYLLKQTGLTIIPTIILTGLLIAIFAYALMVIFRQKKLSNIKNDFINNMTHELKTPISTISLASQMLQDGSINNTPSIIDHVSKVISQESKRLSFQVEKVLQMAVFNEGRLKLKFKEFDANNMISTVTNNFALRVNNKNGELNTEILAENGIIKGDEVHITNVIFNLLDNAMKYSGEKPKISVKTENKKDKLIISVQDNGIGIAKEHQAQIFDRFFRVPTGNVHDVKGFGLGLSYVKKIVDLHNATIKVESAVNKGTKFKIYFPQIDD